MRPTIEKSLRGEVVRRAVALGSKSEHTAVCLQDARGRAYKLRFTGGHPFHDPKLEALVGKEISAYGEIVHGSTLIIQRWKELAAQES